MIGNERNREEAKKAGHHFGRFDINRAARHHPLVRLLRAHEQRHDELRELILDKFRVESSEIKMVSGGAALDEDELQAFADGYMVGALERLRELIATTIEA